jgi:hypothetical protein
LRLLALQDGPYLGAAAAVTPWLASLADMQAMLSPYRIEVDINRQNLRAGLLASTDYR